MEEQFPGDLGDYSPEEVIRSFFLGFSLKVMLLLLEAKIFEKVFALNFSRILFKVFKDLISIKRFQEEVAD